MRRLYETTQFVLALTDADLQTGRDASGRVTVPVGLMDVLGVRLLHASVRVRLLASVGKEGGWDTAAWGVPINQEDLAATALSFSVLMLMGMERVGLSRDWSASSDFLYLWKVVGYVTVPAPVLPRINCVGLLL